MDIRLVKDFLDKIKMYADNGKDETAHSIEDSLFKAVIFAINQGDCDNIKKCCELCLSSKDICFKRLCY